MMKSIKLLLIPQPGAKPEFLADLSLTNPDTLQAVWNQLPNQIVLEGYTREAWAWKPTAADAWTTLTVTSTDGRNKLPGFCDYLKQRQKSVYGRFAPRGVWVVSYVQSKQQGSFSMTCRVAMDISRIPKCNLMPLTASSKSKPADDSKPAPRKVGGLLGKLVGAQQRTNQHVAVSQKAAPVQRSQSTGTSETTTTSTAIQVLADFRQAMHQKMLDFDLDDSQETIKVQLSLAEYTGGLSTEDKTRVTMEILKYMVYEAAEEVNEEWIAHKEPSEFMDEVTIAIYKEGAAPPEVLEEINQGELPDEVRGQQRAIQEQRHRQVSQAESRIKQQVEMDAHQNLDEEGYEEDFTVLNTQKRDRRTIADYEKERKEQNTAKRARA